MFESPLSPQLQPSQPSNDYVCAILPFLRRIYSFLRMIQQPTPRALPARNNFQSRWQEIKLVRALMKIPCWFRAMHQHTHVFVLSQAWNCSIEVLSLILPLFVGFFLVSPALVVGPLPGHPIVIFYLITTIFGPFCAIRCGIFHLKAIWV